MNDNWNTPQTLSMYSIWRELTKTVPSPLMPLPSSLNELRSAMPRPEPSSRCSLPPLPDDATLLWGDRGAWSGVRGAPRPRRSSCESQPCPRGWVDEPLIGGVRETERFRGLCWPADCRTVSTQTHRLYSETQILLMRIYLLYTNTNNSA